MSRKRILCDKTEIVIIVQGKKKADVVHLKYDQIRSILLDRYEKRSFIFFRKETERIVLTTTRRNEPYFYLKSGEGRYFEEYKAALRKFAADNQITFYDYLKTIP